MPPFLAAFCIRHQCTAYIVGPNLWGNLGGCPLSYPSLFAMVASRRQSFPAIPPLPNPHGFALILRHYVQSSAHLFDRSSMAKQNLSHRANVICDGSPSRIRRVRRISFGMTIRPRSSMRLTMPVAFIYCSSTLCVRNHIAIVCKQWGIMRMEDKEGKGRARVGSCRAEYGAFFKSANCKCKLDTFW